MHRPLQYKVCQTKASLLRNCRVYNTTREHVLEIVNMSGKTCYLSTCVSTVSLKTIEWKLILRKIAGGQIKTIQKAYRSCQTHFSLF